jgi:hypothetical protein
LSDAGQRAPLAARPIGRAARLALAVAVVLVAGRASAQKAGVVPPVPAPPPPVAAPPVVLAPAPAPAPAPPVVVAPPPDAMPLVGPPPPPPPPPPAHPPVAPVPTADETPVASDHDAVVGHVGLEVRRIDTAPLPLTLSAFTGCPTAQTPACTVDLGALTLHYWHTRNVALTGGLAFGVGGGRDAGHTLDSYVGLGPIVGMSLLLGNWRHLTVAASPEASLVWFSPGHDGSSTTTLVTVRAVLEGELHFGFIGVPALSLGLDAGVGFRSVSAGGTRVWSVGVVGPGGVSSVLSDLFVRYYL